MTFLVTARGRGSHRKGESELSLRDAKSPRLSQPPATTRKHGGRTTTQAVATVEVIHFDFGNYPALTNWNFRFLVVLVT